MSEQGRNTGVRADAKQTEFILDGRSSLEFWQGLSEPAKTAFRAVVREVLAINESQKHGA